MTTRSTRRVWVGALLAATFLLGACSSDSGSDDVTATTQADGSTGTAANDTTPPGTAAEPEVLRILVTNDDGVDAPGIDAVVEGLRALPDTEVIVVAPATNQSGTGGNTTEGELTVVDATTASGYEAKAVTGFPADTIVWAIDDDGIEERPHLVVSGINEGQNLGPIIELSGTVGAARAAGSRGIPALAASQGLAEEPDWPAGVALVTDWVTQHRAELLEGTTANPAPMANLNVPTCTTGTLRDLVEVPVATDPAGRNAGTSDCTGTPPEPADDIDAFIAGFPSLSVLVLAA